MATLASFYNSASWDAPEMPSEFPEVAMKFEELQIWFKSALKEDGFNRMDAHDIASDAIDFYLSGYRSTPDIIYPSSAGEVYAALDAAKELYFSEA